MKERRGLYTSPDEDSFVSEEEIKRKLALAGETPAIKYDTPVKLPLGVDYYFHQAKERSRAMQEMRPQAENFIRLHLPQKSIVAVWGDLHLGGLNTDYDRIQQELEIITNTPNAYLILLGDLVDGVFWGGASGAEQSQTLDEQRGFLMALFEAIKGRVLFAIPAEHDDKWATRTGATPYFNFTEITGAPFVRGTAEVEVVVGDNEYRIVAQHKARGNSLYNKNHPTVRQSRFGLQGADIYMSAHTHRKQVSQEAVREFNGSRLITHISVGAYKSSDEYGEREGFNNMRSREMYGVAFVLHKEEKRVDVYYDVVAAFANFA